MYKVKFYTGRYGERQAQANADRAICYVEQHFNSSISEEPNYVTVVTASNASARSLAWGRDYVDRVAKAYKLDKYNNDGLAIGGMAGRGNGNLSRTAMPAILLEPVFISSPVGAAIVRSAEGQAVLAQALADSIRTQFPAGGLVAFSVGHKGNRPNDLGAKVLGGGWEADFAEAVLKRAAENLELSIKTQRFVRVMHNGKELAVSRIHANAVVQLNGDVLTIEDRGLRLDEIVTVWLRSYPWFEELPRDWRQVTHRLVRELSAERFVGLPALHDALVAQDKGAVWSALADEDIPDSCVEFVETVV